MQTRLIPFTFNHVQSPMRVQRDAHDGDESWLST